MCGDHLNFLFFWNWILELILPFLSLSNNSQEPNVGIAGERRMKRARAVTWLAIAAHFVSTRIGSNIINRAELMQLPEHPKLQKPRQLNKPHARLPIQVQTAHLVHRQQIKRQLPSLLSPPLPLSRMEMSLHPSDGISWWNPKRNIYASHLEKVSSKSDIERVKEMMKNFPNKEIKLGLKVTKKISPGCTIKI